MQTGLSTMSITQLKSEASMIVTRRCDAAGLNASEFFVLNSRTIHTVCIVSACARAARCTLVERA